MTAPLLLFALALAAVIAGCGGGSGDESTVAAETSSTTSTQTTDPSGGAEDSGEEASAPGEPDIYFTAGEQFKKVKRDLPDGEAGPLAAVEALVDGPTKAEAEGDSGAQTAIPDDVSVESVEVDGGAARVELSEEFLAGVPAAAGERSDSEQQEINARLGQLTYTLAQFDGVERTEVVAGGAAVEPALEARPGPTPAGEVLKRSAFAQPKQGPAKFSEAKGAKSSNVRELQARLAKLRYLPKGAVDGVDGYRTEQAVIAFQSWEGLARDGVVGPATRAALAKAKRPKPSGQGPDYRIEVYREKGVTLLIKNGKAKRAIHTSSGAPGTSTPSGTYSVFRKELRSWSVPFQVWLPYASYFNAGIAFHEYPDVPTFPASHGCVRVPAPEAKALYRFAKFDTTVVVL